MTWNKSHLIVLVLILFNCCWVDGIFGSARHDLPGLLYPRESPARDRQELNGVWNFRTSPVDDPDAGFRDEWFLQPLDQSGPVISMPVPSSFNDITQEASIRDFVGWVWYEREFFVSNLWNQSRRHVLYFGSADYEAIVWLNGVNVVNHSIGHLPFEAEVSGVLKYGLLNRLTVALSNRLTEDTVPQGFTKFFNDSERYPPGYFEVSYNFDFMNYGGLHRPVLLYTTPMTYIEDVTLITQIENGTTGIVQYEVSYASGAAEDCSATSPICYVDVYDKNRVLVGQSKGLNGTITIPDAHLWWPYLMDPLPGYLYMAMIRLKTPTSEDVYLQPFGIRTVRWTNSTFLINEKPFYFRGFGRHEDSDIRGKGLDMATVLKDFNLIRWVGANSFRTSHYPYADEIMNRADVEGIVIIDESPACTIDLFGDVLQANHRRAMAEMIRRDKNHPSVVMWSLANEPRSADNRSEEYFRKVSAYTRSVDPSGRPLTIAIAAPVDTDLSAQYLDVVSVNRYYGWYENTGHLELIQRQMDTEYTAWNAKHDKPILTTEYGADSVVGIHTDPPFVFTEDYQAALLYENFRAFDKLGEKGFFIGEMVWNFADFMTPQLPTRVTGNRKGIFTRQRQPKMAAYFIRSRYWSLAVKLDNMSVTNMPSDGFISSCPTP